MFDYKVIEKEIKVFRFFFFSFLHSFLFAEKNFSSTFVWLISRTTYKVHIVKISRSAANCVFTYPSLAMSGIVSNVNAMLRRCESGFASLGGKVGIARRE